MCKKQPGHYLDSLLLDLNCLTYEHFLLLKNAIKSKAEMPNLQELASYRKQLEDKIIELSN